MLGDSAWLNQTGMLRSGHYPSLSHPWLSPSPRQAQGGHCSSHCRSSESRSCQLPTLSHGQTIRRSVWIGAEAFSLSGSFLAIAALSELSYEAGLRPTPMATPPKSQIQLISQGFGTVIRKKHASTPNHTQEVIVGARPSSAQLPADVETLESPLYIPIPPFIIILPFFVSP